MKYNIKTLLLPLVATTILICFSSCHIKTNQERIAEIIQDQYIDIDQMRNSRTLSLDEAEAVLWCWADKASGVDISEEKLREAIWIVLECNDEVRELIFSIDEIDLD